MAGRLFDDIKGLMVLSEDDVQLVYDSVKGLTVFDPALIKTLRHTFLLTEHAELRRAYQIVKEGVWTKVLTERGTLHAVSQVEFDLDDRHAVAGYRVVQRFASGRRGEPFNECCALYDVLA